MRWEVMIASVGQPSASPLDMTGLVMIRSLTLSLIWSILLGVGLPAVSWGQATEEPEIAELEWSDFDEAKFDKKRFTGPMIVAIMKDLCPGCKAKRDALWSNRKLVEAVVQRKMILFNGNAETKVGLSDLIKRKFKVSDLPVVIIHRKSMMANPIILSGIPAAETIIKALDEHIPLKKKASDIP